MSPRLLDAKQEPINNPLPGLKKQLGKEYEGVPDERIDQAAKHSVELFSARVKELCRCWHGGTLAIISNEPPSLDSAPRSAARTFLGAGERFVPGRGR